MNSNIKMAFRKLVGNAGGAQAWNACGDDPWMARDALVPACCALNPVTGRTLIDDFGPADLAVVRWSLSGLVIGPLALSSAQRRA
jgi:hypothetical protein